MTCLSVSTDGSLLLSGSHDETVRLWDIQSKQCLKTMNHKGRNVLISRILTARGHCLSHLCCPGHSRCVSAPCLTPWEGQRRWREPRLSGAVP